MGNSRATDGGDTASTEGGEQVPRGDVVLHLLSSEPGLVVEVGLFHLPSPSATLP